MLKSSYLPALEWLATQQKDMLALVMRWAAINSHTFNLDGMKQMKSALKETFQVFQEEIEDIDLPPMEFINSKGHSEFKSLGSAIKLSKRAHAPLQVLLVIHMDTVYPVDHPAGEVKITEENILRGPGVCDAKGGIAVLFKALAAFERFPENENVGWTVVINPDEEVGSHGSLDFLKKVAQNKQVGLLYEPCLPSGDLVGARKGSGNFTLIVRGRSAHAGRDHHLGRNAVDALAKCILKISGLNGSRPGLTVNVGIIEGGQALNVVPDFALARLNVRVEREQDEDYVLTAMKFIINEFSKFDGISVGIHGGFFAPPKTLKGKTLTLLKSFQSCGQDLGLNLNWQPSGGVCDGNRLLSFGLPNVDTLGVKGGATHSPNEYLYIDSLVERAKLSALFLMKLADGTIKKI